MVSKRRKDIGVVAASQPRGVSDSFLPLVFQGVLKVENANEVRVRLSPAFSVSWSVVRCQRTVAYSEFLLLFCGPG